MLMHNRILGLLIISLLACGALAQQGWSRYRVFVPDAYAAQKLGDSPLQLFSENVMVGATDVIVGPGELPLLGRLGMPAMFVGDLPDPRNWEEKYATRSHDYQNKYLTNSQIIALLEEWRAENPTRLTRTQIATSIQGRAVWAYTLKGNRPSSGEKIDVVLVCLQHAREWVSPPVGLYILDQLLTKSKFQGNYAALMDKINFHLVPVANPDGYVYSWNTNRYWRKNRRNNGGGSYGVDLNRNWAKAWGGEGSSGNKSSDVYRGTAPFSEPETNGIRIFIEGLRNNVLFFDYHSYSQLILYPWSYTTSPCPDNDIHHYFGEIYRQGMLAGGGKNYINGQSSTTIYVASGVSNDWVYDKYKNLAYAIELRDTGQYGFVLPENQIFPTQKENWDGFNAMIFEVVSSLR